MAPRYPNFRAGVSTGGPPPGAIRGPREGIPGNVPVPNTPYPDYQAPPMMQPYPVPQAPGGAVTGISSMLGAVGAALANNPQLFQMTLANLEGRREAEQEALRANMQISNQNLLNQYKAKQEYTMGKYGATSTQAKEAAADTEEYLWRAYEAGRGEDESAWRRGIEEQRLGLQRADLRQTKAEAENREAAMMEQAGLMQRAEAMELAIIEALHTDGWAGLEYTDPITGRGMETGGLPPLRISPTKPEKIYDDINTLIRSQLPVNTEAAQQIRQRLFERANQLLIAKGLEGHIPPKYRGDVTEPPTPLPGEKRTARPVEMSPSARAGRFGEAVKKLSGPKGSEGYIPPGEQMMATRSYRSIVTIEEQLGNIARLAQDSLQTGRDLIEPKMLRGQSGKFGFQIKPPMKYSRQTRDAWYESIFEEAVIELEKLREKRVELEAKYGITE